MKFKILKLSLVFLFGVFINVNGQSKSINDSLIGKWRIWVTHTPKLYYYNYETDSASVESDAIIRGFRDNSIDSFKHINTLKTSDRRSKGITYEFYENGKYKAFAPNFNATETGIYSLDTVTHLLTISPKKSDSDRLKNRDFKVSFLSRNRICMATTTSDKKYEIYIYYNKVY